MKSRLLTIIAFLLIFSDVYNYPSIGMNNNTIEKIEATPQEDDLSDAQAIKVLNTAYKKYASYTSMKMNIDITVQDGDFSYKKSAKASVKGDKYRLETGDEDLVSNGNTLWIYLKNDESLQITNASTSDQNFFCYPALLLQKYQKYCVVEFLRNEGNEYVVQFTSYNEDCPYKTITVNIDKSTYTIKRIEALEASNTGYIINVKSFEKNTKMTDSTFSFNEDKVSRSKIRDFRI